MIYTIKSQIYLKNSQKLLYLLLLLCGYALPAFSQTQVAIPEGYKEFTFGMTMSAVKDLISKSQEFDSVREEVLTIRTEPDREIITVKGRGFVKRGYFHFNEDKLFHIYLIMNDSKIGYYNLLKGLTEKYGNPNDLDPKRAIWKNQTARVVIEKPSVVKYTSIPVWESLGSNDLADRNVLQINRDDFIGKM